jgi:hypothetical protein
MAVEVICSAHRYEYPCLLECDAVSFFGSCFDGSCCIHVAFVFLESGDDAEAVEQDTVALSRGLHVSCTGGPSCCWLVVTKFAFSDIGNRTDGRTDLRT